MSHFEDIKVWKDSRSFNKTLFEKLKNVDRVSEGFLANHLLKTAGSVMDNIAEGMERGGNRELVQFLAIAKGSAGEVKSQLFRAIDFGLMSQKDGEKLQEEITEISKQIGGFMNYLKSSDRKGHKFEESIIMYNSK